MSAKPLPALDDENRPFWEGTRRHEVVVQRCNACGRYRFPASLYCSSCTSDQSTWAPVTGNGVIESFCIFHKAYFESFADEVPYNVALVRLDEGPRLFTNIVNIPNLELRIGQPVTAVFDPIIPEVVLLKFKVMSRHQKS